MKAILISLFILITYGCTNIQKKDTMSEKSEINSEDFFIFYTKFNNDTNFQNERIIKPLKGSIKYWKNDTIQEESWECQNLTISSKENFLHEFDNLKTELHVDDTYVIEKYWIEHSGFIVEKKFILKSSKWYLLSYDISNL